ncbi:MAG: radical SAM protein [Proteobacteria bacterium]|nr:radical SAM protein [Pseudomonadota bacterium]
MDQDLVITVTEIYGSIQGESSYAGLPCTFVRLTGCPLRCKWCDTAYGFTGGQQKSIAMILSEVKAIGLPLVELTGGEPLAQKNCVPLAKKLVEAGYRVLIETSGSEDVSTLPTEVHIIMDLKAPGSGMSDRNMFKNLDHLKPSDEIKMVLAHRDDFDWAISIMEQFKLSERFNVLLSCAFGLLQPKDLCEWMVAAKVGARLNLQQHKYIWHPRAKGV